MTKCIDTNQKKSEQSISTDALKIRGTGEVFLGGATEFRVSFARHWTWVNE